jgi:sialate O-acetylesterase
MKPIAPLAAIALFLCAFTATRANVTVPGIFGSHMVLQRGMKVPVWGKADAGEAVTVKVAGQSQSTTAGADGKWRVTLDPLDSATPVEMTVTGKNALIFTDVLVGEVWLCSGQSNMSFPLHSASNGADAVAKANRPTMRLFTVGRTTPDRPQDDVAGGEWRVCTPESARDFAAVGYFFGLELQQKLNTPVGLINASWGGTRAEAWMPRPTFDALHLPYEPQWTEQWLHPKPKPNTTKQEPPRPHEAPATLYNGMIAPIAGYAMRGVIWYQGETNTAYPDQYRDVLTALIKSWRDAWGEGDFPFLVVQLANLKNTRFWPTLRAAQAQVAREVPNVGLAVTIDIGNPNNIHPTDKQTVGHRLAVAAEKIAYGQDVPYSGPVFKSMQTRGGDAVLTFDHADGGLVAKGDLQGFEVAGADGKFVPARAQNKDNNVIVHADGVASPAAVRYGWANDPTCTLYNGAGLPAVPFETKASDAK